MEDDQEMLACHDVCVYGCESWVVPQMFKYLKDFGDLKNSKENVSNMPPKLIEDNINKRQLQNLYSTGIMRQIVVLVTKGV